MKFSFQNHITILLTIHMSKISLSLMPPFMNQFAENINLDDRSYYINLVNSMNVSETVAFFYPRLLPLVSLGRLIVSRYLFPTLIHGLILFHLLSGSIQYSFWLIHLFELTYIYFLYIYTL